MNKLTKIIGLAPSELSEEEFFAKLRAERLRVSTSLEEFKNRPIKATRKATTQKQRKLKFPSKDERLKAALKELGMTEEEFIEAAKAEQDKTKEVKGEPMK